MPRSWLRPSPRHFICAALFVAWFTLLVVLTWTQSRTYAAWLEGWHRWDAEWYMRIWIEGYGSDPRMLVFPPGYPYLIGALSWLSHLSFDLTALVINTICFAAATWLASKFVAARSGIREELMFALQLTSPVAFYVFAPYSDSVFLLLFWLALPLAQRAPAGLSLAEKFDFVVLALLAPWIRITGYTFLAWTLFGRKLAAVVLISFALYLALNQIYGGSPFHFLGEQQAFGMPRGWFLDGIRYHFDELVHPTREIARNGWSNYMQTTVVSLISTLLLCVSLGWLIARKDWMLAVTVAAVALFSRNQFYWRSVLRYDWPLTVFTFLPWLDWSRRAGALRWLARLAVLLLALGGLALQIAVGQKLHAGGWAY